MGKQFVVHVEDRPGALAHVARALGARGINIEHIAGFGAGTGGHVILEVSDDVAAREVLKSSGYRFSEGETILATIADAPGSLAMTTQLLADAGINVQSVLIVGHHDDLVDVSFTVDDTARAGQVLATSRRL